MSRSHGRRPSKTGHTHFHPGKRLRVRLRSGETFDDKFVDRRSTYVVLKERGRVHISDIDKMHIIKGEQRG